MGKGLQQTLRPLGRRTAVNYQNLIRTFLPIIIVIILLTAVMSCRNEVVGTVCKVSHQTRRGLQMVSLLTQLQETQPQAAIHAWIHI